MSFNYKYRDNYNDDILCKIRRKKHIVKYNNHISLHKEIFLKPYLKNSLSLVQNWKKTHRYDERVNYSRKSKDLKRKPRKSQEREQKSATSRKLFELYSAKGMRVLEEERWRLFRRLQTTSNGFRRLDHHP